MEVLVQPVLEDNYQFLLLEGRVAVALDPAEAVPVVAALADAGATLAAILITHHHADHVAGVPDLLRRHRCPVIGPRDLQLPWVTRPVGEGDQLEILARSFRVLSTPGHTGTHIAYHQPDEGLLFCGDVILPMGCGRLAPNQRAEDFHCSIQRLAALPPRTRIYCGHEYAEENARFSLSIAPDDAAVRCRAAAVAAQRRTGTPTVPTTIATERESNLFVRAANAKLFAELRRRKNDFQ